MSKPKIRFKGFTVDWEQRKLRDLALFNPKDELPQTFEYVDLESVTGTEMVSHRTETKLTAPSRAQRLACNGDLFYQTVRPYQKNNYLFEKPDNNYVFSTGYAQMRPFVDGYFLLSLVQSERFVKVVLDNCTGTGYPAINANDLAEIEVATPLDENEAYKIGTLFRKLDNLITLHQRKCDETKKLKKYMLQKMFPQNGAKAPEIRFEGFTEDWEQRKYAEVIELLSGQDFNPEEYNEDGIGIPYLTGASCIKNGCTTAVRWTETPRCIAEKGDTVLVCKGSGYGAIATVNQEKAHIARQFMALKVKKHELDNRFNYFLLNSVVENIKTDVRGLIAGIARDAVLKQKIAVPCLNEQRKIGEYFSNLDHLITLHQRRYEELQKIKKFMLKNMFV